MAQLFGVPLPARPGNGLMDTRGHARYILERSSSGQIAGRLGKTKTNVVVPVVRVVPVARRGTEVLRVCCSRHRRGSHAGRPQARSPAEFYLRKDRPSQPVRIRVLSMTDPALNRRVDVIPVQFALSKGHRKTSEFACKTIPIIIA